METILYIEGDPRDARTLTALLSGEYRVVHCADASGAANAARQSSPVAIILDFCVPRGFTTLRQLRRAAKNVPVIIIAAAADSSTVVRAVRDGAADFLTKPYTLDALLAALHAAITPVGAATATGNPAAPFIGSSAAIRVVAARLNLFAGSDYPVLILGESGTGKEVAAKALHDRSPRRAGPFIVRNCAALPELLAESELFGTERGAFTDAVPRPGAFELAKSGVLFLDELGETGLAFQAKLLRVLESGELWRLGGQKPIPIDVRLISATCRDIRAGALGGLFRADLLYRIDTLVLELPPLRARREDIPDLATHFVLCATAGKTELDPSALAKLIDHDWPGNVRQLRNVIHRAVVLADGSERLSEDHIVF